MTYMWIVQYLTGNFAFSSELMIFCQAICGAMAVKKGRNKDGSMQWFHALSLGCLSAFGGSTFTTLWLGKPTALLASDLNVTCAVVAFVLVNYVPFVDDLVDTPPLRWVVTSFSSLFRSTGLCKYVAMAFVEFKDNPSPYYPIPMIGPILYGTILGNMSAFFLKGFDEHLKNGMPWAFQNGLVCGFFFHFFVHDQTGPIGIVLRDLLGNIPRGVFDLDDKVFAITVIGVFVQIMGFLQMQENYGPTFSPFVVVRDQAWDVLEKSVSMRSLTSISGPVKTKKVKFARKPKKTSKKD